MFPFTQKETVQISIGYFHLYDPQKPQTINHMFRNKFTILSPTAVLLAIPPMSASEVTTHQSSKSKIVIILDSSLFLTPTSTSHLFLISPLLYVFLKSSPSSLFQLPLLQWGSLSFLSWGSFHWSPATSLAPLQFFIHCCQSNLSTMETRTYFHLRVDSLIHSSLLPGFCLSSWLPYSSLCPSHAKLQTS